MLPRTGRGGSSSVLPPSLPQGPGTPGRNEDCAPTRTLVRVPGGTPVRSHPNLPSPSSVLGVGNVVVNGRRGTETLNRRDTPVSCLPRLVRPLPPRHVGVSRVGVTGPTGVRAHPLGPSPRGRTDQTDSTVGDSTHLSLLSQVCHSYGSVDVGGPRGSVTPLHRPLPSTRL